MKYKHSICWIRRDLRLLDHVALGAAKQNSDFVTVVFVFDTNILDHLDRDDRRVTFLHQSLQELHTKLQSMGSGLVVLQGDPVVEIPAVAKILQVDAVYTNMDVEPYAKKRDQKVFEKLNEMGCWFYMLKDHVIFSGLEVKNKSGEPFKIFTPYKRQWMAQLQPEHTLDATVEENNFMHHSKLKSLKADWSIKDIGFKKNSLWIEPGEDEGIRRLKQFTLVMQKYHETRNFPSVPKSTSGLSVHLRFGTVSIRACVRKALQNKDEGSRTWLGELIWRDFYQMTLDQFPYMVATAGKKNYDKIRWPGTEKAFKLWCDGKTGYPIVDAAMRHFNETGWMHNRLRMIVATFLCKDLLVDWKKGERYFAKYLLDYDLAANIGGWQWCSSTGMDSQPYFRVFNPVLQSERFDSKGEFIRQHCTELRGMPDKYVHEPWMASKEVQKKANCIIGKDYPKPAVNHADSKSELISLFKKATVSKK